MNTDTTEPPLSASGRADNESRPDDVGLELRPPPAVSIAIPVFNEALLLDELLRRTLAVVDQLPGGPHQIVLVDDGSTDGTAEQVAQAVRQDSRLTLISLSRNFGQQAAISAALDHVRGDVTVIMDADLQDPPESISRLVNEYRRGYDVVYAIRIKRKERVWLKVCYWLFYVTITRMADNSLPHGAGDFGLMSARVIQAIRCSPERHRYLRGLRAWVGFSQIGIPIERDRRYAGEPKFSLPKLFNLAFDGLFAFSVIPLRIATCLGLAALATSSAFAIYAVYVKLFRESPVGFTAIIVAITFLSGIHLLMLGIIGEYIGRIYGEVKHRPLYIVDKVIDGQDEV